MRSSMASIVPHDMLKIKDESKDIEAELDLKEQKGIAPLTTSTEKQGTIAKKDASAPLQRPLWQLSRYELKKQVEIWLDRVSVQLFLGMLLFMSLYLTEVWTLANANMDADVALDVMLIVIFVIFSIECILLTAAKPGYFMGFFFWMDILGTASVLLDISFIGDNLLGSNDNSSVLRAARAAKVGARSSRLAKLMRLFRLLSLFRKKEGDDAEPSVKPARALSQKLSDLLARRVAALVMLLIFIIPLLLISEIDYSPDSYLLMLEDANVYGTCDSTCYTGLVEEIKEYYSDKDIKPVQLSVGGVGAWDWRGEFGYLRDENLLAVQSESGGSWIVMDYSYLEWIAAWYNVTMITIVIILLVGFSLSFNSAVDKLVVTPLERMMDKLRRSAATMLRSVKALDLGEELQELENLEENMESELLEEIIEKLALIVKTTQGGGEDEVLAQANMDASTKNWLASNYLEKGAELLKKPRQPRKKLRSDGSATDRRASGGGPGGGGARGSLGPVVSGRGLVADLNNEVVNSWAFDPLAHEPAQLHGYIRYMLMAFDLTNEFRVGDETLLRFTRALEAQYLGNPYHCWRHGVDVCQTVYRFLKLAGGELLFSQLELFALLVAALGHDAGHPGLNNAYLVKTGHRLALDHNDQSPLENMHCVVIYDTLAREGHNVFEGLDRAEWAQARKAVIACILGTDMMHHFQQIQKLNVFFELNGHQFQRLGAGGADDDYAPECLEADASNKLFLMEIFVHSADISNPVKPFSICKKWAELIMEELFQQGDKEAAGGLDISPMMDRATTNKPNMQMGFLEFVVSPLYAGVVKLFPTLSPCVENLSNNYRQWAKLKIAEIQNDEKLENKDDELATVQGKVEAFTKKMGEVMKAGGSGRQESSLISARRRSRIKSEAKK